MNFIIIVFAFLFVDLFDTVGTLVGVAAKGNLLDKDGKLPRAGKALMADAIGTVAGACLGTSTVTSFVESSAGVSEGGPHRSDGGCRWRALPRCHPAVSIFTAIQGFATAPALIFVGLLMMTSVLKVKFDGDIADAIGAFLAIFMMPFTYSIANGICLVCWPGLSSSCSPARQRISPPSCTASAFCLSFALLHWSGMSPHDQGQLLNGLSAET